MPASAPDRIVLDTNILVSAAITGTFREIVALYSVHDISLFTCECKLKELYSTLNKEKVKPKLPAKPEIFIKLYRDISRVVAIDERFDRSPDPDDNYLFDLAYTVKSFYLVTQEKALLNMKQVGKIKIITFSKLRELIGVK